MAAEKKHRQQPVLERSGIQGALRAGVSGRAYCPITIADWPTEIRITTGSAEYWAALNAQEARALGYMLIDASDRLNVRMEG
jgi:hypothetical protein